MRNRSKVLALCRLGRSCLRRGTSQPPPATNALSIARRTMSESSESKSNSNLVGIAIFEYGISGFVMEKSICNCHETQSVYFRQSERARVKVKPHGEMYTPANDECSSLSSCDGSTVRLRRSSCRVHVHSIRYRKGRKMVGP